MMNEDKRAVILQARLDSVRLPRKALLPLGGRPFIFRVMEALACVPAKLRILACPEDSRSVFLPLAREAGFELFAGSREDVLGRYCSALRYFGLDRIKDFRVIRATGDNAFVFADAAIQIDEEARTLNADYAGYSGLPYGAGVESVKAAALLLAESAAVLPEEREHVCPYLYNHPGLFRLHRPPAPPRWQKPALRITCDTGKDYEAAKFLYDALNAAGDERYSGETIIKTAALPAGEFRGEAPAPCSQAMGLRGRQV